MIHETNFNAVIDIATGETLKKLIAIKKTLGLTLRVSY